MKKLKAGGRISAYGKAPLLLSILLLVALFPIWTVSFRAGMIATAVWLIYIVIAVIVYFYGRHGIRIDLVNFATRYGQVQKGLLKGLAIPYVLCDENGKILWSNAGFAAVVHKDRIASKSIASFFPDLTKDKLPEDQRPVTIHISYERRDYRVDMRKININDGFESEIYFDGCIVAVFFFDETDINMYIRLNKEQSMVTGLVYLDNYDETLESVEDVRRSLLTALIDRKINKYFSNIDAVVKKIEKDKYFVVMKRINFEKLVESKFDILEEVKTVNIGNEMNVTLSIGFGLDTESFLQDNQFARNAIDLALGRGGDQAVVKTPGKVSYFGGKSEQIAKNTRVKARVKAHALKEIIGTKDQLIVMGHKNSDVDSFGASIGIFRAAAHFGKKCYIVINDVTSAIKPLMDMFVDNADYDPGMFITNSEALQINNQNTAVVVVDTNKVSYTQCPELLSESRTIVVLDHHRAGEGRIENATLSYVESYASSACEMVAEVLQYLDDSIKIKSIEADCLYAGIMIDTNNFMAKTGVRTFEAAAFLRRNGADITHVRKLFRNDLVDYKARADAVRNAEMFKGKYAISQCKFGDDIGSPTVVGAQAANELLNINQVKASFVLTEFQGLIYISARAIDEINVQLIMERLGGGGHINIAGAQLKDVTLDEAVKMLKQAIIEVAEEGTE
ncbi:MAG: DHH family phosphoesterase [Lachnospiraceae bacterium]|nr:DHH family phosphoesterase [Lachnospiraceae bacterium]